MITAPVMGKMTSPCSGTTTRRSEAITTAPRANSSEILFDEEFRKKLNLVVPSKYQILDRPNQNGSQYEIVFGVISSSAKKLDIPFFSKLSLKHVANRLKNFGYEVSLVKIDTK